MANPQKNINPLSTEALSAIKKSNLETPYYLYDLDCLAQTWQAFHSEAKTIPNYRVYFAMKSNNNPEVLKFFKNQDCGIDVVSIFELRHALKLGFKPSDIVFSGAGKTTAELTEAVQNEIHLINCESEDEFLRLEKVALNLGKKVRMGFRVNPDVDAKTHPYIATGLKNHKFGIRFETALNLYIRAFQNKKAFEVKSISVHIGSQIQNINSFREAFEKVLIFVQTLKHHGIEIQTFDLGGGLGISYTQPEQCADFSGYLQTIKSLKNQYSTPNYWASELGRALVASCGTLVTKVIGQKESGDKSFLIVDASMTELIRPALYQARHPIAVISMSNNQAPSNHVFEVVGPVCESSDVFGSDYSLPRELKENDLLGIQLAGAYGHVMSSQYNLRPRPTEYIFHQGLIK
jgi:diaminopimelate decarboxylase